MGKWLFMARIYEGAITWSEIKDLSLEELDFLYEKALEIHDRREEEARKLKSHRGRRF